MENITFYEQINLFLESERPRKPSTYMHKPEPVYVGLMHAYSSTDLRMQLGFQKHMKNKYSAFMLTCGMNPTMSRSHSKPLFSHYIKPNMAPFKTH